MSTPDRETSVSGVDVTGWAQEASMMASETSVAFLKGNSCGRLSNKALRRDVNRSHFALRLSVVGSL